VQHSGLNPEQGNAWGLDTSILGRKNMTPKPRYCKLCGNRMLVFQGEKGYRYKCPNVNHPRRLAKLKRAIISRARRNPRGKNKK
jgi:hypothetical protein